MCCFSTFLLFSSPKMASLPRMDAFSKSFFEVANVLFFYFSTFLLFLLFFLSKNDSIKIVKLSPSPSHQNTLKIGFFHFKIKIFAVQKSKPARDNFQFVYKPHKTIFFPSNFLNFSKIISREIEKFSRRTQSRPHPHG
jgi:hypothetical protein